MFRLLILSIIIFISNEIFSNEIPFSSSEFINRSIENGEIWQMNKAGLIQKNIISRSYNIHQKFFEINRKYSWCGLFPLKSKLLFKKDNPVQIEILFWSEADMITGVKITDYHTAVKKINNLKEYLKNMGYSVEKSKNRISNKASYYSEECFLEGSKISFVDSRNKYVSLHISSLKYAEKQKITKDSKLRIERKDNLKVDLLKNVVKEAGGKVKIINIPMIDQGRKGYCAPATVARVLKYYGIAVDMYQLAELMNSDPLAGTSVVSTKKLLKKIASGRPVYAKEIKFSIGRISKYIDRGIPVMWSISHPAHIRLIVGYNKNKKEIVFSDSWGESGRENVMKLSKAKALTKYMYVLK